MNPIDQASQHSSIGSTRPTLQDLLRGPIGRRRLLGGTLGVAAVGLFGSVVPSCEKSQSGQNNPEPTEQTRQRQGLVTPSDVALLGFASVPAIFDSRFDSVRLTEGYSFQTIFAWGDPVVAGAPAWQPDASNTAEEQEQQAGQAHDGMIFYPFPGSEDHGLLVMNHEYAEPETLHPKGASFGAAGLRPLPEVRKEQAAHGVSVIEIRRLGQGTWELVANSKFGRRIHMHSKIAISGPAAGHAKLRTAADPEGKWVMGTLNNCAASRTPWGTYLTCEENFQNYFANANAADLKSRREQLRYGVPASSELKWETADARFDASPKLGEPQQGFVNEVNRFGWVVEIDPNDPTSTPVKRTAMGRFSHENCEVLQDSEGRMAFYMGDDSRAEYFYKFVPNGRYNPKDPRANAQLLDDGRLFVAFFHEDGRGEWLELSYGKNGLNRVNGFADQADVLINARSAADHVGATPMDRPEWVAVNPLTGDIFVTLTNNKNRGTDDGRQAINAANPREKNLYGHIMKVSEKDRNPWATEFTWDIFVLCGDPASSSENLKGNIKGDIFGSPDGIAFDRSGRLWIQTDYDDAAPESQVLGLNQMLAADPESREIRRFLVGPKGCEITGIAFNPSHTAMFINIQHPSLSFPASDGKTRARSATIVISKDDGGEIGT